MITNIRFVCLFLLGSFLTSLAQAEWVDITPSVEISQTRQALDRVNRQLFSYVTIKNSSGSTIQAPLQLNIINPSIPVVNADGLSEEFHDYIQLDNDLLADSEITVRVSFQLARKQLIFSVQLVKDGYIVESGIDSFYNPPSQSRYVTQVKLNDELFAPYLDGGFYISVLPGTTGDIVKEIALSINSSIQGKLDDSYLLVTSHAGLSLSTMRGILPLLESHPEVDLASIEFLLSTNGINTIVPDSNISGVGAPDGQYYLQDAGIIDAWNLLSSLGKPIGGTNKIVGILDTKLSKFHEDLDIGYFLDKNLVSPIISIDGLVSSGKGSFSTSSHAHFVTGIIAASHDNKDTVGNIIGISGIMHQKKVVFAQAAITNYTPGFFSTKLQLRRIIRDGSRIINLSFGHTNKIESDHCIVLSGYDNNSDPVFTVQKYYDGAPNCGLFYINPNKPTATLREIIADNNIGGGSFPKFDSTKYEKMKKEFYDEIKKSNDLADLVISTNKDIIIIQSSGNSFSHSDGNGIICSLSPSHILSNNTLCVAAISKLPNLNFSFFSNHGSVDIATYGEGILSTSLEPNNILASMPSSEYTKQNGTSFSAPIITGIVGLVWNAYPYLTASQVRDSILNGVREVSGIDIKDCVQNGGLKQTVPGSGSVPVANAYCALKYADNLNKQRAQPKNLQVTPKDGEVELTWDSVKGSSFYHLYYSTTPDLTTQNVIPVPVSASPYTLPSLQNGTTYYFAVTSVDSDGESVLSDKVSGTPVGGVTRIDNNVVYDQSSGFYWQDLPISTPGSFGSYKHASSYCANSNLNGLNWKIPNRNELLSIVDKNAVNIKIKTGFQYVDSSFSYLTSDSGRVDRVSITAFRKESSYYQWAIDFSSGDLIEILKRYEIIISHYFLDSVKRTTSYDGGNFRCVSIGNNPSVP